MAEQMIADLSENVARLQRKVDQLNERVIQAEEAREVSVHRIRVWTLARVTGLMFLMIGVLYEAAILAVSLLVPEAEFGFSPLVPLVTGLFGLFIGFLSGWMYNVIAVYLGGLEIEIS